MFNMIMRSKTGKALSSFQIILLMVGAVVLFHYLPPSPQWDTSPDTVVVMSEQWGERTVGDIPAVRLWGDGYFVWLEYDGDRRYVKETYLSQEEMTSLLQTITDIGFFDGHRWPSLETPSTNTLYVNLERVQQRRALLREGELYPLFQHLSSGSGKTGTDVVPATGILIAIPLDHTSLHGTPGEVTYQWPVKEVGYGLAEVYDGRHDGKLAGEDLRLAWELVNSRYTLVASQKARSTGSPCWCRN